MWLKSRTSLTVETHIFHPEVFSDMYYIKSQLFCCFNVVDVIVEEQGFGGLYFCFPEHMFECSGIGFVPSCFVRIESVGKYIGEFVPRCIVKHLVELPD